MIQKPGQPTQWTRAMNAQLRALWLTHTHAQIATIMDLSRYRVSEQGRRLKLGLPDRRPRFEPTAEAWIAAAKTQAVAAQVRYIDVLSGCSRRDVSRARWRAWKEVLEERPDVSLAGLARVAGFHHTSIIHGFKRLRAVEGQGA